MKVAAHSSGEEYLILKEMPSEEGGNDALLLDINNGKVSVAHEASITKKDNNTYNSIDWKNKVGIGDEIDNLNNNQDISLKNEK